MSDSPSPPPTDDELTRPAEELKHNLQGASDGVSDITDNLERIVDESLTHAEEKLDSFIKGLDNFLGKF
jgi:hypothetical protein